MNKSIILLLMLLSLKGFSAELIHNHWYKGYYINFKSDTIKGFVKHRKKPSLLIAGFKYPDGKREKLLANEIKGYGYDKKTFESCYIFKQYNFLERIVEGTIILYKGKNNYYIQKGKSDVVKINKMFNKSIILEYIEDNEQQYSLVKNLNYVSSKTIITLVSDYNKWASVNAPITHFVQEVSNNNSDSIKNTETTTKLKKNQNAITKVGLEKQRFLTVRINIIGIGLGFETKITNNISIYQEGGGGIYLYTGTRGSGIYLFPYYRVHARLYTNLKKRYKDGKKTSGFTGDYISPFFMYNNSVPSLPKEKYESIFFGLNYGFQRQKGNIFYWGIDFGAGLRKKQPKGASTLDYLLMINLGLTI